MLKPFKLFHTGFETGFGWDRWDRWDPAPTAKVLRRRKTHLESRCCAILIYNV